MVINRNPGVELPEKVKPRPNANMNGVPWYSPPRQGGLNALSLVDGNMIVEHPNLAGPPPGSFGMEGRIVIVSDKIDVRSEEEMKEPTRVLEEQIEELKEKRRKGESDVEAAHEE